ncbi:MAG: hypothetical protein WBQ94_07310 [Terracidiphilus sp.]
MHKEEGLAVRRRRRKWFVRDRVADAGQARANRELAMDFIVDGLTNGRTASIFDVVDALTRECLVLEADTSLAGGPVTGFLNQLIDYRGLLGNFHRRMRKRRRS